MKKMYFKILILVAACLLAAGLLIGGLSIFQIQTLGENNVAQMEDVLRADFDRMIRSQIESAMSIADHIYNTHPNPRSPEAAEAAADVIRHIRYGESGYIFVYNSEGDTIVLLGGDAEGTNRWDLQDKRDNYIIRDIVGAAKNGDGFSVYYYPKPGEQEALPKRAYNEYFAPLDWIIGTGNYTDDIDNIIGAKRELVSDEIRRTTLFIIIIDLVIIVLSGFVSRIIGRRIAKPLEIISAEMKKLAEGDLAISVAVKSRDEVGVLAASVAEMLDKFRSIVTGISEATSNINRSAAEIAQTSQQVASGASEQAANAEEISASMEELVSNIQQNTENAGESSRIITGAAADAESGGDAVDRTVEMMKTIAEKIRIIDDIARNTNLLALNASIEAARAGEAGKGFAVVAAEVSKLAANSQNAAGEISAISLETVEKADNTKELIVEMVPVIKKSADISAEILAGSNEQAKGAEQINTALMQMDEIIQANASASEQLASMADILNRNSDELKDAVAFFRT